MEVNMEGEGESENKIIVIAFRLESVFYLTLRFYFYLEEIKKK